MAGLLLVNPGSGRGRSPDDLCAAAKRLGIETHVLADGEDPGSVARRSDAEVLGMAGGDGSLAAVAEVAIERATPFVCIPFGTRNHFAKDAGIDVSDAEGALAAFDSSRERKLDVGRIGEQVFLNNASFGLYARLVHERERRRRAREALARLRAMGETLRAGHVTDRFEIDGEALEASIVLVANNEYTVDPFSLGARDRLDAGVLAVYASRGLRRLRWVTRPVERVTVDVAGHQVGAALDGEPVRLDLPVDLRTDPGALLLRVAERD